MQSIIKSVLTYLSVVALSVSATLYVTENQVNQTTNQDIESKVEKVTKNPMGVSETNQNIQLVSSLKNSNLSASTFEKELWCLKVLGWNEIRNGSEKAMKAVYSVVKNRKESGSYPDSYCKIMKQPFQFSFWNKGKYNLNSIEPKPMNEKDIAALDKIESLSMKVATGKFNSTLPSNVLWYSTPMARSNKGSYHWTKQYKVATQVGPHLFYSKPFQNI